MKGLGAWLARLEVGLAASSVEVRDPYAPAGDEGGFCLPFVPWKHQREAHEHRQRFSVLVWHRRAGKTVFSIVELILAALSTTRERARFAYVAPFYRQAKAVAWDYLKHYARPLPGIEVLEAELTVRFPNGASVRLFGADNPDSLRGLYFDGAVLDEVADMRGEVWGEILRPALTDRQGWALFIGTPKGTNLFSDLYQRATAGEPGWYASLLRPEDTGVIPPEELERAQAEMSPAQFAQEFSCDFGAAIENALIPLDVAMEAARREVRPEVIRYEARVIGVDVAGDVLGRDRSTIARRQGRVAYRIEVHRGVNTMELADRIALVASEWKPDAIFVDETGIGMGVRDRLRQLGYRTCLGVNFGSKPMDGRFENKRAEMWWHLAEWLADGCLPTDQELIRELTAPRYQHSNVRGKVQLEAKDEIQKRLHCSPDKADALALTFAAPVRARHSFWDRWTQPKRHETIHEPMWHEQMWGERQAERPRAVWGTGAQGGRW